MITLSPDFQLMDCDESHAEAILEIFNDAILNSTALYDYKQRTLQQMTSWFAAKRNGNYPVIGVTNSEGILLGFGTYGMFRERPAYKYTIEHSVYIHKDHRGKGLGRFLLSQLIEVAKKQDYHCMMAGIDASNQISIQLHEQLGFQFAGKIRECGYKFGHWLDLVFYQLLLSTPENPVEG